MKMKKFLLMMALAIFLPACSSTVTPASPPTRLPSPIPSSPPPAAITATPVKPQSAAGIALSNVKQEKQPGGEIKATASAATQQNLGLGQVELAYPETMIVGETRTVRLRISPATQLVSSQKGPAAVKTPNAPDFVYKFSGNVDLYPVMLAELRAVTFDVKPSGPIGRPVETGALISWDFLVSAKAVGRQDLSLEISIPGIFNGVASDLSTRVLQDLPIAIQVQPQPVDPMQRILDSITNNAGAIIVALIGLLGTIIGIIVKVRSDRARAAEENHGDEN